MVNTITGAIAVVLIVMFLGEYAVTLNKLPLWVIIGGVLLLMIADYVLSFKAYREMKEAEESKQE
jgi:protein-S-isoprenylcysteine O-methyltransferase Ste14